MAVDKLVDSAQLDADLTTIANAIRSKGGTSAQLAFPAGFAQAVSDLPSGGGGELTLLASGTYTKANEATDNTKLAIPVTVSGTVQGILVYAETPVSGVSQTYGWWRNWLVPQSAMDLFGNNPQITMLYKTATGNPVAQPQNVSKVEIDAGKTTVTVYARDTNYVVRDNTYIWELWGIA